MTRKAKKENQTQDNQIVATNYTTARSIQLTQGLFYSKNSKLESSKESPLNIIMKGALGVMAENKKDGNPGDSIPTVLDSVSIPTDHDTLIIKFNAMILPNAVTPHVCNSAATLANHNAFIKKQKWVKSTNNNTPEEILRSMEEKSFGYLTKRYVWNIFNTRFLFRNKLTAKSERLAVSYENKKILINPQNLTLHEYTDDSLLSSGIDGTTPNEITDFIMRFIESLQDEKTEHVLRFQVSWQGSIDGGSEVWPSQRYLSNEEITKEKGGNKRSRIYLGAEYCANGQTNRHAALSDQKINAAIQSVDNWSSNDGTYLRAGIYPRDVRTKQAYRIKDSKKKDLGVIIKSVKDLNEVPDDANYILANFIKGGMYCVSKEDAKEAAEQE